MAIPFLFSFPYGGLNTLRTQRKYLWNVILPLPVNLPIKIPFGLSLPEPGIVSATAIDVEFGMPAVGEMFEMDWGNRKIRVPHKIDVGEVSLRLVETEFSFAMLYFKLWWQSVFGNKGLYGGQNKYKRTVLVVLLTTGLIPNTVFKLSGCFPKSLPTYSLNYRDNDIITVDVKLSVDYVDAI